MKPGKNIIYIRGGIIYHGNEAIQAKKEVEAKKLADEIKSSLENIATGISDQIDEEDSSDDVCVS